MIPPDFVVDVVSTSCLRQTLYRDCRCPLFIICDEKSDRISEFYVYFYAVTKNFVKLKKNETFRISRYGFSLLKVSRLLGMLPESNFTEQNTPRNSRVTDTGTFRLSSFCNY